MKSKRSHRRHRFHVEPLEDRRMFAGEPWGAFPKLINQDLAVQHYSSLTGAGTSVAILDTGIDYMHPALGGGFGPGYKVIAGYDFIDHDSNPMDPVGHGTSVAGMVAANSFVYGGYRYQGLAPGANLIALRTEDGTDVINASRVEAGLQWVIANRARYNIVAVNMSIGEGHYATEVSLAPIADELATLKAAGVFIVASSGNDGVSSPYGVEWPGADPNVYAIGSVNASDVISDFTERGPNMDLLAPGEDVPLVCDNPDTGAHIYWPGSGTSFAAPQAAAAAALLRQLEPSLTPDQIMAILRASGSPNYDGDLEKAPYTRLTYPRLDLDAAIAMAYQQVDDACEENDTRATAYPLPFVNDVAEADNLRLLVGDNDFYEFTLPLESSVDFYFGVNGSASMPRVDLRDSAGNLIVQLASGDSRRLAPGTYYLKVVAGATTLADSYWISVQRTEDDACESNDSTGVATPLSFTNDAISMEGLRLLQGDDDYYRFILDAESGVYFDFGADGGGTLASLQLLNANGASLGQVSSGQELKLAAGTYYLKASAASGLPGTYWLYLDRITDDAHEDNDTPASATPLPFSSDFGQLTDLQLLVGDDDYYSFTMAREGESDFVLALQGGDMPELQLLNASGTLLGTYTGEGFARLPAGTYRLRVVAGDYSLDGSYSLSVSLTPDDVHENNDTTGTATTISLASGSAHLTGLKLLGGDDDYFAFNLDSAANVSLLSEYSGGLAGELLDAGGRLVATFDTDGLDRELTTGRYFIHLASDQTLDGTYGLTLAVQNLSIGSGASASAVAFDKLGRLHMAWFDASAGNLKYAVRTAGVWSAVQVVDVSGAGRQLSLAVTSTNLPRIAYYDSTKGDLRYASYDGANWRLQTVDSYGTVGRSPSIALDSSNRAGISYYDASHADLRFALFTSAGWSVKTIDSGGDTGVRSSIAYNRSKATWMIAYERTTGGLIRLAQQASSGGSFSSVTIEDTTGGSGYVSMALDRYYRPAVAYYDAYKADLRFAHFDGKAWKLQTVASSGTQGQFCSVSFAADGKADILYYSATYNAAYLAHGDIGSWSLRRIASGAGQQLVSARNPSTGRLTAAWRDDAADSMRVLDL